VPEGMIKAKDIKLLQLVDEPEDVLAAIFRHYESRDIEPSSEEQEILLQL